MAIWWRQNIFREYFATKFSFPHNISCSLLPGSGGISLSSISIQNFKVETIHEILLMFRIIKIFRTAYMFEYMDASIARIWVWLHTWWIFYLNTLTCHGKFNKRCVETSCPGHSSQRRNYSLIVLSLVVCEWLCGTWREWTNSSFKLGPHAWKW